MVVGREWCKLVYNYLKKITIAMLITLISIGNINAQEMKTPGLNNISRGSLG